VLRTQNLEIGRGYLGHEQSGKLKDNGGLGSAIAGMIPDFGRQTLPITGAVWRIQPRMSEQM
jgi:hypothetical protein